MKSQQSLQSRFDWLEWRRVWSLSKTRKRTRRGKWHYPGPWSAFALIVFIADFRVTIVYQGLSGAMFDGDSLITVYTVSCKFLIFQHSLTVVINGDYFSRWGWFSHVFPLSHCLFSYFSEAKIHGYDKPRVDTKHLDIDCQDLYLVGRYSRGILSW